MENCKNRILNKASFIAKYIRIHVYICFYPILYFFFAHFFKIEILPNFIKESDGVFILICGLAILFVPSLLWFVLTMILKKIHPVIIIIYFALFAALELFVLSVAMLFITVDLLVLAGLAKIPWG